jgi:hypothetical protein
MLFQAQLALWANMQVTQQAGVDPAAPAQQVIHLPACIYMTAAQACLYNKPRSAHVWLSKWLELSVKACADGVEAAAAVSSCQHHPALFTPHVPNRGSLTHLNTNRQQHRAGHIHSRIDVTFCWHFPSSNNGGGCRRPQQGIQPLHQALRWGVLLGTSHLLLHWGRAGLLLLLR